MQWSSLSLLVILSSILLIDSKHLGQPDAIKSVSMARLTDSMLGGEYTAIIKWKSFESNIIAYIIELMDVQSEAIITTTVERKRPGVFELLYPKVDFEKYVRVKQNKTYIVTVKAVNQLGLEGPASPSVIFFAGGNQIDPVGEHDLRPRAPTGLSVTCLSEHRVNVTWDKVDSRRTLDRRYMAVKNPIEYTIHYGYTEKFSEWSTRKTNETWIVLDDLNNEVIYSTYVTATEKNETSPNSEVTTIEAYLDMPGLPEPIITIEPDNGRFYPGDEMHFNCSLPSYAINNRFNIELTVGKMGHSNLPGSKWATVYTDADMDIDTAICSVTYSNSDLKSVRVTTKNWEVTGFKIDKNEFDEEHSKRRMEEIENDRDFRKL